MKTLSAAELRRLIKAHNVLTKITIPKGAKKEDLLKLIEDAGFKVNHEAKKITKMRKGKQDIEMDSSIELPDAPVKLTKEEKLAKKKATAEKKAQARIKAAKELSDKAEALKNLKKVKSKKPQLTEEDKVLIAEAKKKKKPKKVEPSKPVPKTPSVPTKKKPKQPEPDKTKEYVKPPQKNPDDIEVVKPEDISGEATPAQVEVIAEMSPEKIMDDYKSNSIDYFVPYVGNNNVILLYMIYVLENNNNDCSISEDLLSQFVNNSGGARNIMSRNVNTIASSVVRCMKREKILCVPVYFTGHANMLIFNYHRGEVERYEPNGVIKGKRDSMQLGNVLKKINGIIKEMVKKEKVINSQAFSSPKFRFLTEDGFKYLDPQSVSATEAIVREGYEDRFENFQYQETLLGTDGKKRTSKKKGGTQKTYGGVVITEAGGYCVAFSFMYLDLRLKFPLMEAGELISRCLKQLNTKRGELDMIRLIAGQTKLLYENGRKMIDEGYMTEKIFITATSSEYFEKDRTLKVAFYNTTDSDKFIEGVRKYLTEKGVWARMAG